MDHVPHIIQIADSASYRERNENRFRHPPHHIDHDVAFVRRRRNIVKYNFIRALCVIFPRRFHGIADIYVAFKLDPLGELAVAHVEAGNDSLADHDGLHVQKFFKI